MGTDFEMMANSDERGLAYAITWDLRTEAEESMLNEYLAGASWAEMGRRYRTTAETVRAWARKAYRRRWRAMWLLCFASGWPATERGEVGPSRPLHLLLPDDLRRWGRANGRILRPVSESSPPGQA